MYKVEKLSLKEKLEKRKRISKQYSELAEQGVPVITCSCGKTIKILHMHKCYYCGEFYCPKCAKDHFK